MIRRMFLSLALIAAVVAPSFAAEIAPGEKAPEFKGLVGTDGKEYGLADMKDAKAVVVVFTCNRCPVAIDYEDRFIEFTKKYKEKGVSFVAINCNRRTEDLEAMKARAEEKGFNFPYVFDKTGATATEYGARVTPHIFVLDGNRAVQYVGAFDNSANEPTKHYVVDAVEAILAGKAPEVTQTKAVGCGIAK
ncbi:alkyl hydroperoxide reductase/ Thiol specific antioxidant/ Mal allergen [Pirellula staleyi DSM 6068]|uniref:Alkyl hydroperoxide reductase/ Thiol specific antioxidant/ Mal allergen n=1 Tax=Pirellula staleyi (strain ATCC 27377 / DSM 6068 / ICPB 4128) TaxID=530564 RepID=D2QYA5_PIRSD|nr:thioredoxin family protein [Pirellula staleyi]ADB16319.1 alkyl hydroperoxide reductase/ Thiol specific antioxidant/ Mal allergen [Pirellula staleyi DSM 6068]